MRGTFGPCWFRRVGVGESACLKQNSHHSQDIAGPCPALSCLDRTMLRAGAHV